MDLQYFHANNIWFIFRKYTVAVDVPSKEKLLDMLQIGSNKIISLKTGYSLVNPKDNYNKKLGRDICNKRSKINDFQLTSVEFKENDNLDFIFEALYPETREENHCLDEITISVSMKRSRPYLINARVIRINNDSEYNEIRTR